MPARDGRPALGLALKVSDGDAAGRARNPATASALLQLRVVDQRDVETLGKLAQPRLRNVVGREVGRVRPILMLERPAERPGQAER
jgi:L-asparaginase II